MTTRSGGRGRPRIWARGPILIVLVTILLVGVGIYVGGLVPQFPTSRSGDSRGNATSERLTLALQRIFAADCPSASQASRAAQNVFSELGYTDWSVQYSRGVTPSTCVDGSMFEGTHTVMLLPALSAAVRSALQELQDNSYDGCLTERQLTDMLTAVLTSQGEANFDIRPGPLVAPTDLYGEVENHVLSGCWVYSTTGLADDGHRMFFVAGPRSN